MLLIYLVFQVLTVARDLVTAVISTESILATTAEIARQMQQGQALEVLLQWTIDTARALLKTDRVLIYRILEQDAVVAFESVDDQWMPIQGQLIYDPCFQATWIKRYTQGQTTTITDAHDGTIAPCYVQLLESLQVQANVVVPIVYQGNLWGLLIAHHCHSPREWQPLEVQLLQHIALQLGIAVQLAKWHQTPNRPLERYKFSSDQDITALSTPQSDCLADTESRKLQPVETTSHDHDAKYQHLIEHLNIGFVVHAPNTQILHCNPAACTLLGLSSDQLLGKAAIDPTWQFIREDGAPMLPQDYPVNRVLATCTPLENYVLGIQSCRQQCTWFLVTAFPEFDTVGQIQQVVVTFIDITRLKQAEVMLRRYERVVATSLDCIALVDQNYIYRIVNQTYSRWNQKALDEIVGHSISELLGQDFFETYAKSSLDRCLAGESRQIVEAWLDYPDSQRRFVRAIYAPYVELDGSITGVVINVHDLTALKQAELENQALRERLEFLLATSPVVLYSRKPKGDFPYTFISENISRLFGYNPTDFVTVPGLWSQQVHPDDAPRILAELPHLFEQGHYIYEYRFRQKDGHYCWVQDELRLVQSAEGTPTELVGCWTVIDERKHVEERLQTLSNRLELAVQSAQIGIWELDIANNQLSWDDQLYKLYGIDASSFGGVYEAWIASVHPDDLAYCQMIHNQALAGDQDYYCEFRIVWPDGTIRHMQSHAIIQRSPNGQPLRMTGVNIDVSDRKQAEEQLQLNQAKFEALLMNMPGMVYRYFPSTNNSSHYFTFVSSYCNELLELPPEALLRDANTFANLIHPDDLPSFLSSVSHAVEHFLPWHWEGRITTPSGKQKWIQGISQARYSPEGAAWDGLLVDISDHKAAEIALQISQARFAGILEIASDAIISVNAQQQITLFNQGAERIFGYTAEEALGQPLGMLLPDRVAQVHTSHINQYVQSRQKSRPMAQRGAIFGRRKDGTEFPAEASISQLTLNGEVIFTTFLRDISERQQAEAALQESEARYRSVITAMAEGVVLQQADGSITAFNATAERILGLTADQIAGKTSVDLGWRTIHEDGSPFPGETHPAMMTLKTGQPQTQVVMGICKGKSATTWISINSQPLFHPDESLPYAVVTSFADITSLKQAELALKWQSEQQALLMTIAQHLRQSLDLDCILNTTVTEVQKLLQADRVIIYQFASDWSGCIIAEAVTGGWHSILGQQITDTYFATTQGQAYKDGRVKASNDIYTAQLDPCHIELLEQMQVRAKLVVPILLTNCLWGLLVAQQCGSPRSWQASEIELQQRLATQIAIAIQQAELYQQVQTLNTNLELQVQERTAQLQQALEFESLLKRITDQIRDSLDEEQILQTVVRELAITMGADCCDTTIYSADRTTATVRCDYTQEGFTAKKLVFTIADSSDTNLYIQLAQGQYCHFCLTGPNVIRPNQPPKTILACPIMDDQGILGDLWLFKSPHDAFSEQEIRLVQQIANQCAIALRQSRLYQAAQAQVQELERLHQLKDDFLSTVSHELRTPMSSIKMATQMLEISLEPLGVLNDETNAIGRYVKILRDEGQREIALINDLLDLTRLDSGSEPLKLTPINLQFYIPHLAEAFIERTQQQQQQLVIHIPDNLPSLTTDLPYLERLLTELLHNACKYTPSGETITVAAQTISGTFQIDVSNTGVEIPATERERIFDKFYRIPKSDPWKHGGTGLGLALVKKLTQRLGGQIHVVSDARQTTFRLEFKTAHWDRETNSSAD